MDRIVSKIIVKNSTLGLLDDLLKKTEPPLLFTWTDSFTGHQEEEDMIEKQQQLILQEWTLIFQLSQMFQTAVPYETRVRFICWYVQYTGKISVNELRKKSLATQHPKALFNLRLITDAEARLWGQSILNLADTKSKVFEQLRAYSNSLEKHLYKNEGLIVPWPDFNAIPGFSNIFYSLLGLKVEMVTKQHEPLKGATFSTDQKVLAQLEKLINHIHLPINLLLSSIFDVVCEQHFVSDRLFGGDNLTTDYITNNSTIGNGVLQPQDFQYLLIRLKSFLSALTPAEKALFEERVFEEYNKLHQQARTSLVENTKTPAFVCFCVLQYLDHVDRTMSVKRDLIACIEHENRLFNREKLSILIPREIPVASVAQVYPFDVGDDKELLKTDVPKYLRNQMRSQKSMVNGGWFKGLKNVKELVNSIHKEDEEERVVVVLEDCGTIVGDAKLMLVCLEPKGQISWYIGWPLLTYDYLHHAPLFRQSLISMGFDSPVLTRFPTLGGAFTPVLADENNAINARIFLWCFEYSLLTGDLPLQLGNTLDNYYDNALHSMKPNFRLFLWKGYEPFATVTDQ